MDDAASPEKTDDLWGKHGTTVDRSGGTFPTSDDGNAHNWFFGMNFALNFNLTADYVGPLEYYFFGGDICGCFWMARWYATLAAFTVPSVSM